jgi:diguanylate cyclase
VPSAWLDAPAPDRGPFEGFAAAAAAAVAHLNRQQPGMDLWLVTCVEQDRQLVIAPAGAWAALAPVGATFSWQASFCVRMVSGQGPAVAPRVAELPVYRQVAVGPLARVRAYLGVPLLLDGEELFGTLCAFAGGPRPDLADSLPTVSLIGRMLSTVLAGAHAAQARSAEAAQAYALAERDPLTRLRNRRGFEAMLRAEQERCHRFGARCSILVLDVDDLKALNERAGRDVGDAVLQRCAELLTQTCQSFDVIGRVDGAEFAALAVETELIGARALATRLRRELRTAQLPASLGVATRQPGEDLTQTWQRAKEALHADQRRHGHATPIRPQRRPLP